MLLIFTVSYLRSSRCSDRKQAAAHTGSLPARSLQPQSLAEKEGEVFLPTLVTAFQCGTGEKHPPEFGVWHIVGSPPFAGLKGTQVFQCNLVYKFILFLKERTQRNCIRIWENSSEPRSTSSNTSSLFLIAFGRSRQMVVVFLSDPEQAWLGDGVVKGREKHSKRQPQSGLFIFASSPHCTGCF